MLQVNNNNNYSCLKSACKDGGALEERERGIQPFTKLFEMGSFSEMGDVSRRAPLRGLRAWAMGSMWARSRRWAVLHPAGPVPLLRRSDTTESHVSGDLCPDMARPGHGWPGVGLEPRFDDSSRNGRCGSRQGSLGALVTVATVKASERGGQTQTQCFLLQAKEQIYHGTARRHSAPTPGVQTQLTPATTGHRLGEAAASEPHPSTGKGSKLWKGKDKPKPVRKWRTSCEADFSIKQRVLWDCEDRKLLALGPRQEHTSKLAHQTSTQDAQAGKQGEHAAETAKNCTPHEGIRNRSAISLREAVEESDRSSSGVEEEGRTLPSLSFACRQDSDPTNPEADCSPADLEGPIRVGMQDGGPSAKLSLQNIGYIQAVPGDKSQSLGAGSKSEGTKAERNSEVDLAADCTALTETGSAANNDLESNGREESLICGRGRAPHGHVAAEDPQSPKVGEDGPMRPMVQWTHHVTGCSRGQGSFAKVEEFPEQLRQSVMSNGSASAREVGSPKEKFLDDTVSGEGVWTLMGSVESPDSVDGQTVISSPDNREYSCESSFLAGEMGECKLPEVLGGGHLVGLDEPEAGEQRMGSENRGLIWQADNSLLRGLDLTATNTLSPPNPAPPEAMETALSSLEGSQDGVSLLGKVPPPDLKGGMVASGERLLDLEREGDDDFGLFIQAGEQLSWNDNSIDFQQVPGGKSESVAPGNSACESNSAHWIENPFCQSVDTWTAFSQEGSIALDPALAKGQHMESGGQWWPQMAAEECSVKLCPAFDMLYVFQAAFPVVHSSCLNHNPGLTLRQLLQDLSCEGSPVGDSGRILDGLQDVNTSIGLKYKWAESHSQTLLLQSLHLNVKNKGHVTNSRANDSHSVGLLSHSHHVSPLDKVQQS
ncbi:hypothetical protein GJAV_G00059860 [Gymnothorax javanicus]|nr:hypothetical protein GJAV_G00059860 [Gymnothorax javanicus]